MSDIVRQAALAGDEDARTLEEIRIHAQTKTIDLRVQDCEDRGSDSNRCYRTQVHDPHEYDEEVWSEPRWVNPRTVWKRWCVGVYDESPYLRMGEFSERGVWVWKQDPVAPPGEFAICRRLIVSPSVSGAEVNLTTEIWKSPPREWPPVHVGSNGAGLNIDAKEARALRDWLTSWLEQHDEVDG